MAVAASALPTSPVEFIDVALTTVEVAVLRPEDGVPLYLPHSGLVWEEPAEAWAGTVKVELPDANTDQGSMADLVKIGTPLILYASEMGPPQEIWRGIIRSNPRSTDSASFTVTAYELHSVMLQTEVQLVVKSGEKASDFIRRICTTYNIPVGEITGPDVVLPDAYVERGKKLSDVFKTMLDWVASEKGGTWQVRSSAGKLDVVKVGTNADVWWFMTGHSTIRSSLEGDFTDLVTRVVTLGQSGGEDGDAIVATKEGMSEFGEGITKYVTIDGEADPTGIEKQAEHILASEGFPKWKRTAEAPLLIRVRKGDRIRWQDRLNSGYYIVEGVTKDISKYTMSMTLQTQEDLDRIAANLALDIAMDALNSTSERKTKTAQVGNAIVLHAKEGTAWTSGGTHGGHPAVDIFANPGEPILAPEGGTMQPMSAPLGGNCGVLSGTESGKSYYFAHCQAPMHKGVVKKGQTIGAVGNTGNAAATAAHCHFAIATSPDVFNKLNGSGDVQGGPDYWVMG